VSTPGAAAAHESDESDALRSTVRSLQGQNAALRQLVAIHDRLGALVLQGADVAAITRDLADLVGRRVLLLDSLLQVIAAGAPKGLAGRGELDWAPGQDYVRAVLAALDRERRPLRVPPMVDLGLEAGVVLAPVAVGDETASEDLELQIVQHASTVYALSLMRERMAAEVARQLKNELFEGLLLGRTQDEQVARERAMRLGYDPQTVYRVLVLAADTYTQADEDAAAGSEDARPETVARRRRLLESLAELCARRAAAAFAALREDELVVLVPEPDSPVVLGRTAVSRAAALLPEWRVTVGVGGPCTSAGAIARSYAQARRALETAQRFGRQGEVVQFEDLGLYRLLFHVTDPAELRGFVEQVLGPLLEYDRRHNADFVRTLGTYLEHNGNLQATARELNLHVNSVGYRLQRIQAIAQLDLEKAEDRLLAQVALKIVDAQQ
jgi:PucR family transcriptional regulator, purine catabolism regulatory protein